jgi:mandelamide amidase
MANHACLRQVGGSSGGAGSAVASYVAPICVTEDTGGSTRIPATANGNFGFDPSRGHYPNDGNPGMSYIRDQLGLNARSESEQCASL